MITAADNDLWIKNFLIKSEEDKVFRYIFDEVQEMMHDLAIELPNMELSDPVANNTD